MTKYMTKCYLDSNVLIYAKDETSLKYREAYNLITELVASGTELYISPLCLDEFLHEFVKIAVEEKSSHFLTWKKSLLYFGISSSSRHQPAEFKVSLEIVNFMKNYLLRRDVYHLSTMLVNNIGFRHF